MFNYQVIDFQNQKYIVRRRIRETDLIPDFDTEALFSHKPSPQGPRASPDRQRGRLPPLRLPLGRNTA